VALAVLVLVLVAVVPLAAVVVMTHSLSGTGGDQVPRTGAARLQPVTRMAQAGTGRSG
jgi:hypothetical protein